MKVNFKRVATAALAVAMSLSLAAPAFAAGNGGNQKLTVTGDTLDNKKVYAVQMFDARLTEGGSSNTFDNYELVNAEKWLEFFTAGTGAGGMGLTDQDKDGDTDADDARAYLEKMTTESAKVKAFADKAQAWVRGHAGDFEVIASDSEDPAVADKETFNNLKPGYYLVFPEMGSTGTGNRGTDAMLVNVPRDNDAVLNIKSTFPTVEKTVEDNNNNTTGDGANGSAQVGDIVTFTLTSKVPDMSDYNKFYFAFNDTLTRGLKIVDSKGSAVPDGNPVSIDNLTITIGEEPVTSGYKVSLQGTVLKVEFTNLKEVAQAAETEDVGKEIVVTYQAMITEDATTVNPATNKVELEYSNDPNDTTHGTSTPDISKVYTYDIDVNKFADGVNDLAGAEFVLSTSATAPTEDQIEKDYANYNGLVKLFKLGDNSYRVAKPDDTPKENSFLTTNSGDINIAGLEAGTYYLHEVKAPESYNKLKAPITIVITMTDHTTGAATITVNGKPATGEGSTTVDVENKKGIELPETGSIGTIGLTVAGVAIVLVGVFAPRKKKENQE